MGWELSQEILISVSWDLVYLINGLVVILTTLTEVTTEIGTFKVSLPIRCRGIDKLWLLLTGKSCSV